ncbi:GNAT family N-acetyltransferase [Haloechinothrix halophila]|uniref:GNAT family N-acetyltransferase n=1 Tax=Haloechinothrix halophila TaxID=1069073 RepID=UPI000553015F|nr:GNAT family N-acetyltransferase [Haloechinothrix halophila]
MRFRDATAEDWPRIWPFLRRTIIEGTTLTWDPNTDEVSARAQWMHEPPGRTIVAVDDDGRVVGTSETHPNKPGPGSHVANAGFLVDPDHGGKGIGRRLAEYTIKQASADGYRAMQFNAVVETNTRAVELWRSLGFTILTTVPEAFHHPEKGYVGLHVMYRRL